MKVNLLQPSPAMQRLMTCLDLMALTHFGRTVLMLALNGYTMDQASRMNGLIA